MKGPVKIVRRDEFTGEETCLGMYLAPMSARTAFREARYFGGLDLFGEELVRMVSATEEEYRAYQNEQFEFFEEG